MHKRASILRMTPLAGLLLLTAMLLNGGVAQAAPQYIVTCDFCHRMPPLDSGTNRKDPVTGAVPGNHQGHATSAVASCTKCHGDAVAGYTTSHLNRVIELPTIDYSRKVAGFLNQTSVPPIPLGSCSNVACHSDGKGHVKVTPAWGSSPFQAPADCVQCHDAAPATGSHPVSGSKHGIYYGTGTGSCNKCHPDHPAEAKPFAHATSAGRAIKTVFATVPNSGGTFASTNCSGLYCHSNGVGGAPNVVPTWGGSLDCTGCHNSTAASGAPMVSGKHGAHVNNAAILGVNYNCVACHAKTVSNDTTIADVTRHVNGFTDFSGAKAGRNYNSGTGVCSILYCHSDGKSTYKDMAATGWKSSATLDCKGCHGSDAAPAFSSTAGEPNYANGGAGQLHANTHQAHVSGATDCINCHVNTVDGTGKLTGSSHSNGIIDVAAGNGKNFVYDTDKYCSNISCHSGNGIIPSVGTVRWGATLGCAGCHGDASTLATNAHAKHVSILAGKGYACATCHANTVSGSSVIINKSLHGNGVVDVAGSFVYTPANKSCAVTCHLNATPQWNAVATGACGTCHAALSGTANGLIGTNAHAVHFTAAYGPNFDGTMTGSCAVCHVYTTDIAVTHDNGTVDLGTGFSRNGTCSTCHQQTTSWAGGQIPCESCHTTTNGPLSVIGGLTAPDKSQAVSSGHGRSGIDQACTDCHDRNTAHIFTTVSSSRRLLPALTGSFNAECKYCHDSAVRITDASFRNMSTHFTAKSGGQTMACAQCHDPHGTTNLSQIRTTIKGQTITYNNRATGWIDTATNQGLCQACHTQTTYFKAGTAETSHPTTNCFNCHKHNASGGAFKPNGSCDACHGYPPAPRLVTTPVIFGTMNNWSSARFEDYSGGGGAHLVAQHVSPTAKPSERWANCAVCHNGGVTTPTTYHKMVLPVQSHISSVHIAIDQQYRFSNDFAIYTGSRMVSPPARNATGSCFNVSCHMGPTPRWSIER